MLLAQQLRANLKDAMVAVFGYPVNPRPGRLYHILLYYNLHLMASSTCSHSRGIISCSFVVAS